jgi:hypothetical protein
MHLFIYSMYSYLTHVPYMFLTFCSLYLMSIRVFRNYWLFGLCPPSSILKTRKQLFGNWICFRIQISEETPTLKLALSNGPNRLCLPSHLGSKTDSFSKTFYFLVFGIRDDGQSPKSQKYRVLYTIVRILNF